MSNDAKQFVFRRSDGKTITLSVTCIPCKRMYPVRAGTAKCPYCNRVPSVPTGTGTRYAQGTWFTCEDCFYEFGPCSKCDGINPWKLCPEAFNRIAPLPELMATTNEQQLGDMYRKMSDSEHVLSRPDNYVGEMQWIDYPARWCVGTVTKPDKKTAELCLIQTPIKFCPALFQLFEEAVMNVMDHHQRYPLLVNDVRILVDEKTGRFTIRNNGPPIDVAIHPKYKNAKGEQIWIPTFMFGESRTSRNYDDTQERKTGGRNGVGIKVVNALCVYFKLVVYDSARGLYFEQEWHKNMTIEGVPSIRPVQNPVRGADFVEISFIPDYARFGATGLTPELLNALRKRVWEMAVTYKFEDGPQSMNIYWNNELISFQDIFQYLQLYHTLQQGIPTPVQWLYTYSSTDVQIAVGLNLNPSSGFQQVSFVNNINTYEGGTHVACVLNQISPALIEHVEKKVTDGKLSRYMMEKNLFLFVNLRMDKPEFEHQTKKRLTSFFTKFAASLTLPPSCLSTLTKSTNLMEKLFSLANKRAKQALKQLDGKKVRHLTIAKLEDATAAGGAESMQCTLIICEGDSAKALAMAGLSAVHDQRKYFGVFPIRGKFINVCDCPLETLKKNHEFKSVIEILGLHFDEPSQARNSLRYGRLVIMTDQDDDGTHIKGLLINLFRYFWPTLFQDTGFICEFNTPIVKARRGKVLHIFYSTSEYHKWKSANNEGRGWDIKYYKGLGTSTAQEGKEYFGEMDKHVKPLVWKSEKDTEAIALAFDKDAASKRGEWLDTQTAYRACKKEEELAAEDEQKEYTYAHFIDTRFYEFGMAANERAMTSMVDGFTPARRKLFHIAWKFDLKKDDKVQALVGLTIKHAGYHRGEQSLAETACKMAQNYVGSNNMNLLIPSGQFGTREELGDDAASSRYINTRLSPLAEAVFSHHDDALLPIQLDDGRLIEPKWYLPVFPLCLTNPVIGGIGLGKKGDLPGYHPLHVVQQVYARVSRAASISPLIPWYRGFKGTIIPTDAACTTFRMRGKWEWKSPLALHITEIPVGTSIAAYKEYLAAQKHAYPDDIVSIENTAVDDQVALTITFANEAAKLSWCKDDDTLCYNFQLNKILRTNHLQLFDPRGCLTKYRDIGHIIDEFIAFRYPFYVKRREYMLAAMKHKFVQLSAQARFIEMVNESDEKKCFHIRKVPEEVVLTELAKRGFPLVYGRVKKADKEEEKEEEEQIMQPSVTTTKAELASGYHYLVSLSISKLTLEQSRKLRDEYLQEQQKYDALEKQSPIDLWMKDLNHFITEWNRFEQESKTEQDEALAKLAGRASGATNTKAPRKRKQQMIRG